MAGADLCPRCEETLLVTAQVRQELSVDGVMVVIPDVKADRCPACGFQARSGRAVALSELILAQHFESATALVERLRAGGYGELFLREEAVAESLAFAVRSYVATLADGLRELYLDSESGHVLRRLADIPSGRVRVTLGEHGYTVRLPKIGEGENGVVFDYEEATDTVLKLAKPRAYSRNHIREECEVTAFYMEQGIPVPRILDFDPWGSYCVKERLAGESLARLYDQLGPPSHPLHRRVREEVDRFLGRLIELFSAHPEVKTSLSPNNIFVLTEGDQCRCLLVDTGPAPTHDYSRFDFTHYWEEVVPEKIQRYRQVGYI